MNSLPHSAEYENLIVGAILVNPFLFAKVVAELTTEDFYTLNARQVFQTMIQLDAESVDLSETTILHHLKSQKANYDIAYIVTLQHGVPVMTSDIRGYIAALKKKTALRRLLKLGSSIAEAAQETNDPLELLDDAEQSILEIRKRIGSVNQGFRSFEEIDVDAGEIIERLHKGESLAVPTGYKSLDRATRGGNQPGDVWVIASLTGRGKSSWALGAARQQAVAGIPVAFISKEMSEFENYTRVLSASSGVPAWRIKPGMFPDTYYSLQEWRGFTSTLPIVLNCGSGNLFQLRGQVRDLVRNKGIKSLFVDYLQLLNFGADTKLSSRAQEVATVSRVLKEMAMEHQIAVFALAQFNRYAAHGERPEIHHLAESSGIEKDASVVLILDMPEQKPNEPDRECEMRIAKHRNGPCLSLKYRYRGDILTFEEAA